MKKGNDAHGRPLLYPKAYGVLKAFVFLFGLVMLGDILLLGLNGHGADGSVLRSVGSAVSLGNAIDDSGDILRIDPEGVMSHFDESAPPSFRLEVMDKQSDWCSADDQGVIAGFAVEGDSETAMDTVRSSLEENGWKSVQSGQAAMATFAKSSGEFRWAIVSISSFDEEVSVTINARRGNGKS